MRVAAPPPGVQPGRYQVKCASAKAEREWQQLCEAVPDGAAEAYRWLSNDPLARRQGRQFPLKGKRLKPFWEIEVDDANRIYYAVCLKTLTVIIAVRSDVHRGADVAELVGNRASAPLRKLLKEGR